MRKVVSVEPMMRDEAGRAGLIRRYSENGVNREGYKVVYNDGRETWESKKFIEGSTCACHIAGIREKIKESSNG
jgi:hypothetical protein